MDRIVLATANARYSHTSLALRYLKANIHAPKLDVTILEFTIDERAVDIVERIMALKPNVVCLSIYIWNTLLLEDVACLLKKLFPETTLVLGGPEISFETELQKMTDYADYVIVGEGESLLNELVAKLQQNQPPSEKILSASPLDLRSVTLPYHLYTDDDIANRVVYLEASRGCPFGCEFCLSSMDRKVRRFSEKRVLEEIETLLLRGVTKFKFIDRSIHLGIGKSIMDFFSHQATKGVFVHFELVPDRLSASLIDSLSRFPAGSLQLEVGVQTLNAEVAERIGRKQNGQSVLESILTLKTQTQAHLHTDLVVGLPGENLSSFAAGFDSLAGIRPHEIQIGILKRLRGAPIGRHSPEWKMVYNSRPPYDILQNKLIDFESMQRLKRFARYFDLIYNSGNFVCTWEILCDGASPFYDFMQLTDWLFSKTARTNAIALNRLYELLFVYLKETKELKEEDCANTLFEDNVRAGRKSFPQIVRNHVTSRLIRDQKAQRAPQTTVAPKRQQRHLKTE